VAGRSIPLESEPAAAGAVAPLVEEAGADLAVRGFVHHPVAGHGDVLVLTHGAGSDCRAPLLVAVAHALAACGILVLRCDLPYRQGSPMGPPSPRTSARDRDGLREAVRVARRLGPGRAFLGGHSYGGRQSSLVAAEDPALVDGLCLLAYPLHPPGRPDAPRTAHLARLRAPVLFVHGSRDPFATLAEIDAARALIPAATALLPIEGGDHALVRRGREADAPRVAQDVALAFLGIVDPPA
jgi:predicted alpha/beta-hydrolase family hydrolase